MPPTETTPSISDSHEIGHKNLTADSVRLVRVLLPLPLGRGYSYAVPDELRVTPGDFVSVPLGTRKVIGVVWDGEAEEVPAAKLKAIAGKLDCPPMAEATRRFVDWVASYAMAAPGSVLKMAMSVPEALAPPTPIRAFAALPSPPQIKMTPARQRVLDVLVGGPPRPASELAREAGVGVSVVKGLADAGLLISVDMAPPASFTRPDLDAPGPTLSSDQQTAADDLAAKATEGGYSVTVLEGVPGSGKTEVYIEAVRAALLAGKQALVLLPEIALGAQWLDRFRQRFGVLPAIWHSEVPMAQRRATWRAVATGEAQIVVGARSALFLPYQALGIIVVDEEHDASFKQDEGVIYNGRDMAVVRAHLGEIPTVLVSATPSLETANNAETGRYGLHVLADRHGGAALPDIHVVDMRAEKMDSGNWLSPQLVKALAETFAAKEQALLYLNRRGYAPLTLCRACGHRLKCPSCTAWLVEHRLIDRLQCHHCGYSMAKPKACPECKVEDKLFACGPGVERLAEEVTRLFPEVTFTVAASDTIRSASEAQELVRRIEDREVDLIIGTQIVAKGYHFPYLTLVGVVDADLGLEGGDLRAAERTFQLLYQVAGRAGRAERPGRVFVQTFMPENKVMKALSVGDRAGFVAAEADERRDHGMPPFGRLAGVILSSVDARAVDDAASALNRTAPRGQGMEILGPAQAPLAVLRGRHRRRFLVKADRNVNLQRRLADWIARTRVSDRVKVQLDIDPYSFL